MTATNFKTLAGPTLHLRLLASVGPAFAVSAGYMDPGNWATDTAAGAFGTRLLAVIGLANVMAIVMQLLAVRLGGATGEDLATHIGFPGRGCRYRLRGVLRHRYRCAVANWYLAISCCDRLRAYLGCGFGSAARVAVGIIGATVMPHNLFLHSALVAERRRDTAVPAASVVGRFSRETCIALSVAGLVNAAILIVGGALPHASNSISDAYSQLGLHFTQSVALVFGGALVIAGIASSISATVAGTLIFQGFGLRTIPIGVRRIFTLGPPLIATLLGVSPTDIMIWSQVALAFALPIVAVPLLILTIDRHIMGVFRSSRSLRAVSFAVATICIARNVIMIIQFAPPLPASASHWF